MNQETSQGVPYLRLSGEYESLREEWHALIDDAGSTGAFILGPNVNAFEKEVAAYLGVRNAVSVANGTDALVLSLRSLGIGPGDEVITTPFTFFATAEAVSLVGAVPVFADIQPDSFNLDPESVRARIGKKTQAILPVHIFGNPADMTALTELSEQQGLSIIEDAAQAFGARCADGMVGSLGTLGCFSFYPTKVLGCYGDGGLVTTGDDDLADHLRRLRNHGAVSPFMHSELGHNSRLDEVQAALLRIKLRQIEDAIARRRSIAAVYDRMLEDTDLITPADSVIGRHVYNLYTVRSRQRDALREHLNKHKVGNSQCYPLGLHLQQVYRHLGYRPGQLPVVDAICEETLSLPIFPDMRDDEVERVCELVRQIH